MRNLLLSAILLSQASALIQSGTGAVAGRLYAMDGAPAPGIRIVAVWENSSVDAPPVSTTQTDRTGSFRLENLPPGPYHILAGQLDSFSYYPGSPKRADAATVSVFAGATAGLAKFRYLRSSGIVRAVRTPSTESSGRYFGSVRDVMGTPLPNTTIIVSTPQANARLMTTTNLAGDFEFRNLPMGPLRLIVLTAAQSGINQQGYELFRSSFAMEPNTNLQEDIRLRIVSESGAAHQPDVYVVPFLRQPPAGAPQRVGTGLSPLHGVIAKSPIVYPQSAKDAHIEGSVTLQAVVGIDGKIVTLRVMSPDSDSDLTRAAVESVNHWRFNPSTFPTTGEMVEVFGTITVNFSLGN